jgi:alkylation response protein AidB-like acyl-CoA dehydrogenase
MLAAHYACLECLKASPSGAAGILRNLSNRTGTFSAPLALAFSERVVDLNGVASTFISVPGISVSGGIILADDKRGLFTLDKDRAMGLRKPAHPGSGLEELEICRLSFEGDPEKAGMISFATSREASGPCRKASSRLKLLLSATMLGNSRKAQVEAVNYAKERKQTGRLIIDHQEVRRVLFNSESLLLAVESFVMRMAAYTGPEIVNNIPVNDLLFRFAASSCERICLDAIQTLAGYGYMKDYGLEKRLRDTKTITALTGSYLDDIIGG